MKIQKVKAWLESSKHQFKILGADVKTGDIIWVQRLSDGMTFNLGLIPHRGYFATITKFHSDLIHVDLAQWDHESELKEAPRFPDRTVEINYLKQLM